MSYELIGILTVAIIGVIGHTVSIVVAVRGFREISRIQRALGGLVVQESERLQSLLRGIEARS